MKNKLIKISYNIGVQDLETKKKKVKELISKGHKVKIEMRLRGRENYLYANSLERLSSMFSEYKIINKWQKDRSYYLFLT